ncbi:MAG: phosphotransferase [Burkholderiaceae bacterium]
MKPRIAFSANTVHKRFASPALAERAAARSRALATAGMSTPVGRVDAHDRCLLHFDRIDGPALMPGELARSPARLRAIMALIRSLHTLDESFGLRLGPVDPLERIRPRFAAHGGDWMVAVIAETCARLDRSPQSGGLVHGDLHAGQFIIDTDGALWIVDLDDLAIGPPEADLGNFAAHMATVAEHARCGKRIAIETSLARVERAYAPGPTAIDRTRLRDYACLALIRRALKRAEHGDADLADRLASWLPSWSARPA